MYRALRRYEVKGAGEGVPGHWPAAVQQCSSGDLQAFPPPTSSLQPHNRLSTSRKLALYFFLSTRSETG